MKRTSKKIALFLLVFAFVLSLALPSVTSFADEAEHEHLREMITYYRDHGSAAETDILYILSQLSESSPETAEIWAEVMAFWQEINETLPFDTVIPKDLPEDDSLAIVILGYALNDDGSMQDELIGRLQTGLAFANQYPQAYVVVTGGGTAKNAPEITEGDAMGAWLIENGLDETRLIIEDTAANTILNAENTFQILNEQYPTVNALSLVTSDYHMPRAYVLFYTKCLLHAHETASLPMQLLPGCGFAAGHEGYESRTLQAANVASIAGVQLTGKSPNPIGLTGISVTKNRDNTYQITANYENGFSRNVSEKAAVSVSNEGISLFYTENGITVGGILKGGEKSKAFYTSAHLAKLRSANRDNRAAVLRKSVEIAFADAASVLTTGAQNELGASYLTLCNTIACTILLVFFIYKGITFREDLFLQKIKRRSGKQDQ